MQYTPTIFQTCNSLLVTHYLSLNTVFYIRYDSRDTYLTACKKNYNYFQKKEGFFK